MGRAPGQLAPQLRARGRSAIRVELDRGMVPRERRSVRARLPHGQ
ncbi:hypothetical protein Ga0080559_TMP474 [Salipiger profundus]|uniref:Uncharacterized protein n=1 Tax=Salipiger profundus TaxID=1229727 RepID=A0A1U7CZK5_9RHOB|nr:hypothetical protein Ga0080559_TMP474 [Salipiger profundus]